MNTLPVRRALAVLALWPLAAAGPALAWDPQTHESIARLALLMSPAAEARVGGSYAAFYAAVSEPDAYDKLCHSHPGARAPRDPATIAAQVLEQIRSGKMVPSAYARAQALGRLAHYVADCAVPDVMAADESIQPATFWAQTTFAVFREKRPVTTPFAESLRRIGSMSRWGDESTSAHSWAYRNAVNLVIDTLLALPAPAGASATAKDEGPAIFGVDRLDNGMASSSKSTYDGGGYRENYSWYQYGGQYTRGYEMGTQTSASLIKPPTDVEGLHLIEVVTHGGAPDGPISIRALLYNNDDLCAGQILLTDGTWRYDVPDGLAPRSVRVLELDVPRSASLRHMRATWKPAKCSPPYTAAMGSPVAQRVVLNAGGGPPRIDDASNSLMIGK